MTTYFSLHFFVCFFMDYVINFLGTDKSFDIDACEECLVKVKCTRSMDDKTLCDTAYCEIEAYLYKHYCIDKQ